MSAFGQTPLPPSVRTSFMYGPYYKWQLQGCTIKALPILCEFEVKKLYSSFCCICKKSHFFHLIHTTWDLPRSAFLYWAREYYLYVVARMLQNQWFWATQMAFSPESIRNPGHYGSEVGSRGDFSVIPPTFLSWDLLYSLENSQMVIKSTRTFQLALL